MTTPVTWARHHPWAGDLGLAVLVAVPVGSSTLSLLGDAHLPTGRFAAVVTAAAVLHATVAIRRVAPIVSFVLASVAAGALVVMPDLVLHSGDRLEAYPPVLVPSTAAYAFALFAVAAYAERPARLAALAVGLAGAVIALVRLADAGGGSRHATIDGGWQIAFTLAGLIVAVVAAWSLGAFRRMHAAYAEAEREERLRAAAREERARLARELHDVVAHSLAVIVRQAEAGRIAGRKDPVAARQVLDVVAETGRDALGDMRSLLGVLRADDRPAREPAPTLADVDALVERIRASGLAVTLTRRGTAGALDRTGELAAFRIVQEGLTNVVKHAGDGARVSVELAWHTDGLEVSVVDDGGGRALHPMAPGGHGLLGLRERVQLVGGRLDAAPEGDGFALRARIPVRR